MRSRATLAALAVVTAMLASAALAQAACTGARPGAVVTSRVGQCTLDFLFTGAGGSRYAGTAGHCILDGGGQRTWPAGKGPVAKDGSGHAIGRFAFAVLRDSRELDFSLIRLAPGVNANPRVCQFGGPTGINRDRPSDPVVLDYYGEGVGVGSVLPGRSAVALGMPSAAHVYAQGVAVPGDSGSGVISSDGRAVGVLVTVGVHAASLGTDGVDAGLIGIVRITPQLRRAERALGRDLRLQTARH